jgi:hypothetical protein
MSRWRNQVAPVLQALDRADEHDLHERGLLLGYSGAKETLNLDLDDPAVHEAMLLLSDLNYVAFNEKPEGSTGTHLQDVEVRGEGKQALGEWPRFELLLTPSTLGALLEMMAEQAESEEERSLFKEAADYVRSLPVPLIQSAGVAVSIQLARAAFGLG